jgi:hypothetical protein
MMAIECLVTRQIIENKPTVDAGISKESAKENTL